MKKAEEIFGSRAAIEGYDLAQPVVHEVPAMDFSSVRQAVYMYRGSPSHWQKSGHAGPGEPAPPVRSPVPSVSLDFQQNLRPIQRVPRFYAGGSLLFL